MNNIFDSYLLLIFIIIICLVVLISILIVRLKKQKSITKAFIEIDGGSISVFFDRGNNVIIIPYAKDKYGVGRAVGIPLTLKWPFGSESLGDCIRKAMKMCKEGNPCPNSQLMTILDYSSWKEFTQGRRNISVHYKEGYGVVLNSTTRRVDGSYQFNHFGIEKAVSGDATDKQLGDIILEVLVRCK